MRIQHNIMAMNAYRNYNINTSALSKNLEKLSSGYKINRAGDDAAGLAISEKMRAQITGLNAATKNVKDGISLVKTAEGAMQEIQDMLNRMDYLATQSANGTYQDEVDREALQDEVNALRTEINRIAESANFNGIKLLDGSLDAGTYTGTVKGQTLEGQPAILPQDATAPFTEVGSKTVLKQAPTAEAETKITVNLQNVAIKDAQDGDKIKLTIGSGTDAVNLELTVDDANGTDADKISIADAAKTDKLAEKFKDLFANAAGANGQIAGQAFTATNDTANTITFTQTNAPTNDNEIVDCALPATVTHTPAAPAGGGGGGGTPASVGGAAKTGVNVNWTDSTVATGGTAGSITNANVGDGFTFDNTGLADYINDNQIGIGTGTTALNVKIGTISSAGNAEDGKLGLYVDNTLVGVAVDGNGDMVAFQATDGNGTAVDYDFVALDTTAHTADTTAALGTMTVKDDSSNPIAANAFATAVNTDSQVTPGVDAANLKAVNFSAADTTKLTAAAEAATANDGDITVKATADGSKAALYVGTTKISEDATVTTGAGNTVTFQNAAGETLLTMDTAALTAGTDLGTADIKTGLTFTKATGGGTGTGGAGEGTGTWNVSTTKNQQGAPESTGQLASTQITLNSNFVTDGGKLTIGENTYVFAVGSESKVTATGNETLIDLKDVDPNDTAAVIKAAGIELSNKDGQVFDLGYDQATQKLSIHEHAGQTTYDSELRTHAGFQKLISAQSATRTVTDDRSSTGKPLTLQIGDTSDSFNQMEVNVGDMHVEKMGTVGGKQISDISVANQDDAAEAVQVIKDAINYVSSVRGKLGATQNRLEHTQNNLSVMAENIQDAESTIRDTDVAEEMMSYVKNNILVQSAQAMLAQANQVPQGVLQLLG